VTPTDTGLQTTSWLGAGRSAKNLVTAAAARGYEMVPLTDYAIQARQSLGHPLSCGLQLGFGAHTPEHLRTAIRAIGKLL
jgi:DNA-binding transcriptional MocR family regulator